MSLAALAFAPGLAFGSFLNVVAARLPLKRSLVHPPSACMSCGSELAWYDNVPLVAYGGGMGMGDVKLALLMGAALGRTVPVAMFVGMMAALVPGVVLMVRHGRAARKMGVPFGPFLALGSVVALFAGHALLGVYWHLAT